MKTKLLIGLLVAAILGLFIFVGVRQMEKERQFRPSVTGETGAERDESMRSAFAPSADSSKATAVEGDEELEAELLSFFQRLGKAYRDGDKEALFELYSVEGLFDYAEKSGLIDLGKLKGMEKVKFRRDFIGGVKSGMGSNLKANGFSNPRIMRVEKIRDGEVIVYLRSYGELFDVELKMRYWLLKNSDGNWQLYDYEDLEQSLRASALLGALLKPGGEAAGWTTDFVKVVEGVKGLGGDDLAAAFQRIQESTTKLLKSDLPPDIEAFALSMRASSLVADGSLDDAMADLERLEELQPGAPGTAYQRGVCLQDKEQYREAIEEYQKYVEVLGADKDVYSAVGECHYQLGEMEQCLAQAELGIAESANALECLSLFALAVPEARWDEVREKVKKTSEPEAAYEMIIDYAMSAEVESVRDRVLVMLEEDFPESELIEYYKTEIGE